MMKLNIKALGMGCGVLWAVYIFLAGITAMFGWGNSLVDVMSSLYIGYEASILGAVIGAVWGFIDGFILGVVIAWVYNKFSSEQ